MRYYDETLRSLQEQIVKKRSLEAKSRELQNQKKEISARVQELERIKCREEKDVDQLEGHSLAAFYYAVIGKKEDKLDKERAEAYAARVKFDTAKAELDRVEEEISRIQAALAPLSQCERNYQKTLEDKCQEIKSSGSQGAEGIFKIEEEIGYLESQRKEVKEAVWAGQGALRTTEGILSSLSSAEGWATWDVVGGGIWSDMAKHSKLDQAQRQVEALQADLMRFKTELADIEIYANLQVSIDGFLRFADYFFDNIFTDWTVMNQIKNSQSQVADTKRQIEGVLNRLDIMDKGMASRIQACKNKLEQLVLQAE